MGMLHTASPHDDKRVKAIMPYWPDELRQRTRYYQMDSMALFMQLDAEIDQAKRGTDQRQSRLRIRRL